MLAKQTQGQGSRPLSIALISSNRVIFCDYVDRCASSRAHIGSFQKAKGRVHQISSSPISCGESWEIKSEMRIQDRTHISLEPSRGNRSCIQCSQGRRNLGSQSQYTCALSTPLLLQNCCFGSGCRANTPRLPIWPCRQACKLSEVPSRPKKSAMVWNRHAQPNSCPHKTVRPLPNPHLSSETT